MTHRRLSALLFPLCFAVASAVEEETKAAAAAPPAAAVTAAAAPLTNSSAGNSTSVGAADPRGFFNGLGVDSSMIQRALYVLVGFTMIGLLYFLIRAVRLKRPAQRKKYGLLLNSDSVEMEGAESEEDETLFEARNLRR